MAQQMYDLVDDLIDTSPNTRQDKFNAQQKQFSVLMKKTQDQSPLYDSSQANDDFSSSI